MAGGTDACGGGIAKVIGEGDRTRFRLACGKRRPVNGEEVAILYPDGAFVHHVGALGIPLQTIALGIGDNHVCGCGERPVGIRCALVEEVHEADIVVQIAEFQRHGGKTTLPFCGEPHTALGLRLGCTFELGRTHNLRHHLIHLGVVGIHNLIPLAAHQRLIEIFDLGKNLVVRRLGQIGVSVGSGISALLKAKMVHLLVNVLLHAQKIGVDGIVEDFVIRSLLALGEGVVNLQRLGVYLLQRLDNYQSLAAEVGDAEIVVSVLSAVVLVDDLGIEVTHHLIEVGEGGGKLLALFPAKPKSLLQEGDGKLLGIVLGVGVHVPALLHKIVHLELGGLDIAYVQHPDVIGAGIVGLAHLLCHNGEGGVADPKIAGRTSPVGNVVVHTEAIVVFLIRLGNGGADIAVVVLGVHQTAIRGQTDIVFEILGGFLIDAVRSLKLHLFAGLFLVLLLVLGKDLQLCLYRFLYHGCLALIGFIGKIGAVDARIVDAAQTNHIDVLEAVVAGNALFPVGVHRLGVDRVVIGGMPAAAHHFQTVLALIGLTPSLPLALVVAKEHLAVAGGHHDAVLVGQLSVIRNTGLGIDVLIEGIGARCGVHTRPKDVRLQTEQQLEHVSIYVGARLAGSVAIGKFRRPFCEVFLIVEEDSSVFYVGFLGLRQSCHRQLDLVLVLDLHVTPVVPRRHADLLGQLVGAVDGATLVTAHDDNRFIDALDGILYHRDGVGFPLPLDPVHADDSLGLHRVDEGAVSQRTHDDGDLGAGKCIGAVNEGGLLAGHPLKVLLQIAHRTDGLLVVGGVHVDYGSGVLIQQQNLLALIKRVGRIFFGSGNGGGCSGGVCRLFAGCQDRQNHQYCQHARDGLQQSVLFHKNLRGIDTPII